MAAVETWITVRCGVNLVDTDEDVWPKDRIQRRPVEETTVVKIEVVPPIALTRTSRGVEVQGRWY